MKLPLVWLMDYLPPDAPKSAFMEACRRWNLEPGASDHQSLARLLTFAGFAFDGFEGQGESAVLNLDVLSNRPDAQCVLGLAREVAAIIRVPLKLPSFDIAQHERGEPASSLAKVRVEEPDLCPRYTARIIRGVKIGESPKWLKDRLTSMGLTPRNNVVDVTNFVLFELNQPLHAFDLNGLAGREIVVRRARDKEPFEPLYGTIPPLTSETLVIADAEKPRAIGGVIGGKGSEVTPETTDILLEAAYFNPANTRRTVRRLKVMDGKGTDSSYRFERGIDLDGVAKASARAARLIVEVAGGTIAPGVIDVYPKPLAPKSLSVQMKNVARVFGAPIPQPDARRILSAIGCEIQGEAGDALQVAVPTWRRSDLEREIDLIEEIARLHGYNNIPETTAMSARVPPRSPREKTSGRLRTLFTSLGYFEAVTDSLIDPRWPAPAVWSKEKPLALDKSSVLREDHSALRNSLLASLLAVRKHNQDQRTGQVRMFEIGTVFLKSDSPRPTEKPAVCIIDDRGFQALADTIGRIGDALELDGARLRVSRLPGGTPDFLSADQSCRVLRVREMPGAERAEDLIGWMGLISPSLQKGFDLRKPLAACELDLAALASLPSAPRRYRPLPAFPEVVRDVSVEVEEAVAWSEIESFARDWQTREPLRDAHEPPRFLSVFRGKQIGAGKKAVAFSLVYRAADRTLTDDEVNAAHQKFVAELLQRFKAVLRT